MQAHRPTIANKYILKNAILLFNRATQDNTGQQLSLKRRNTILAWPPVRIPKGHSDCKASRNGSVVHLLDLF